MSFAEEYSMSKFASQAERVAAIEKDWKDNQMYIAELKERLAVVNGMLLERAREEPLLSVAMINEGCAVTAWNVFMDAVKKRNASPSDFQDFCASSAIRALVKR